MMLKRLLCLSLPAILMLSINGCGFRESDITESEAFRILSDFAEENDLLDSPAQPNNPADNPEIEYNEGSRITDLPYLPIEALITTTPGNNEFSGKNYYIQLFPHEYGESWDRIPGYFISGYALHEEDENFSGMAIGGIPSMDNWSDIFDSFNGFLIAFQYVGYSEEYNKAYGIYIDHETTPDLFYR